MNGKGQFLESSKFQHNLGNAHRTSGMTPAGLEEGHSPSGGYKSTFCEWPLSREAGQEFLSWVGGSRPRGLSCASLT